MGDYAGVAYALGASTNTSANDTLPGNLTGTGVNLNRPRSFDSAMLACRAFNSLSVANTVVINGFQKGTLGGRDFRSMTTFASVLDGLSNTAFVGEKAVHKDRMGVVSTNSTRQDGWYYYATGNPTSTNRTQPGVSAYFMRRLAPVNDDGSDRIIALKPTGDTATAGVNTNNPNFRFGSWHPGVSLFLLGDGSVRQVSNSTSNIALQRFGSRQRDLFASPPSDRDPRIGRCET